MICSKCGTKSPDNVGYCTKCGEHFAKPRNNPRKTDPALSRKYKLIAAGVAAVILVIAIALVFAFSGNQAEKAAKGFYKAVAAMDVDKAVGLLPPAMVSYGKDSLDLADSDFHIVENKAMSTGEVEELDAVYGIRYGTREGYIDEATVIYAEVSYHGRSLSEELLPIVMVQIGGDWYLEPLSTSEKWESLGLSYDFSALIP